MVIAHESIDGANASAEILRGLGGHARRLLEECVEHQGVKRGKLSSTAETLEDCGFVFIRDEGDFMLQSFRIAPSLAGEEALEALELMEASARPKKAGRKGSK
jgi:hypothetical protein